jgi:hypothetical protein
MGVSRAHCNSALASALHASCATIHRTLGMMPGGVMFNRNMFLNIPLLMNFHLLQICRQAVIDDNLCRSNHKRCHHDYQPGDECLILDHKATKMLNTCFIGPFPIIHAHIKETISTIQRTPDITKHLNI